MTYWAPGVRAASGLLHIWRDRDVLEVNGGHHETAGPPLCGDVQDAPSKVFPMEDLAESIKHFLHKTDEWVCPACVEDLEHRHDLPVHEYRTPMLQKRIREYYGVTEVGEMADTVRELLDRAKREGMDPDDLTLTVSEEVHEALQSDTVRVAPGDPSFSGGLTTMDGVSVMESDSFEVSELTVSVDAELDPTEATRLREKLEPAVDGAELGVDRVEEAVRELTGVDGVGREKALALYNQGYESEQDLKEASQGELAEVGPIGTALAARIKASVGDADDPPGLGDLFS